MISIQFCTETCNIISVRSPRSTLNKGAYNLQASSVTILFDVFTEYIVIVGCIITMNHTNSPKLNC